MSEEVLFTDILEPRRNHSGIFKFMSRSWNPQRSYILEKQYSPQDLKDLVATSVYLDSVIEAECARTGARKEKLHQDVLEYLEEMGLDKKLYVIRWMGVVFLKICFMMKVGVFVNEPAILKLKATMGSNPVLFLPTHRSYADFCLMTYLCYHFDIDFPAVAAGMDFYSMAVVGRRMRETCAFYIRRTLQGAPLYAATLKQYVKTLVARHCAPIEFFLEGTRSRSNKSLPPKYGMLSMCLAPYFSREVRDITVVPVNISYDRLMETSLFAYEHLGVPKPKESTGNNSYDNTAAPSTASTSHVLSIDTLPILTDTTIQFFCEPESNPENQEPPNLNTNEVYNILSASNEGKGLLLRYQEGGLLNNAARRKLCNAIISSELKDNPNKKVSSSRLYQLAFEINQVFKKESAAVYFTPFKSFNPRQKISAQGKLLDCYRQKRRDYIKSGVIVSEKYIPTSPSSSSASDSPRPSTSTQEAIDLLEKKDDDIEQKILWLKNCMDPWSTVQLYWEVTTKQRLNFLTESGSIDKYFQEFKALNQPGGLYLGLLKSLHNLNDHFGNIYINLGAPFSVREYLQKETKSNEILKPVDLQQITPEQFNQVQDIANYVITQHQKSTVATISNLLAFVLMQSIIKNEPLKFEEIIKEMEWMTRVLKGLGASVYEKDVKGSVERILVVHSKIMALDKDGKLKLVLGAPMVVSENVKTKMKGHVLGAETMRAAASVVQLQLYVNPLLHLLVPPALLVQLARARPYTHREQLISDYHYLRKLLKHEFFHVDKDEASTLEHAMQYCVANNVIQCEGDRITLGEEYRIQYLLQWAVWPALTTLLKCADVLSEQRNCEHKNALKLIQARVEASQCHPYCLSLESIGNCLNGLTLVGATVKDRGSAEIRYIEDKEAMERTRQVLTSVVPEFRVHFGAQNAVIQAHAGLASKL